MLIDPSVLVITLYTFLIEILISAAPVSCHRQTAGQCITDTKTVAIELKSIFNLPPHTTLCTYKYVYTRTRRPRCETHDPNGSLDTGVVVVDAALIKDEGNAFNFTDLQLNHRQGKAHHTHSQLQCRPQVLIVSLYIYITIYSDDAYNDVYVYVIYTLH